MRPLIVRLLAFLLSATAHAEVPPLARQTADGLAVPQLGRVFSFPRDHGSHPEFRIEWWYITGHLFAPDARRFGFQATFFRRANDRDKAGRGTPAFGDREVYLAHMSLLDATTGRFLHEERLNRDGWDASAATDTLALTNGNWSLHLAAPDTEAMRLVGSVHADALFQLTLTPGKPLVVFGEDSVSRKGADPTAASHYLTFTRLQTSGTLRLEGRTFEVSGRAWMDHEISSSQLDEGQTGWDWCSLQLQDGWDLMAYRLRRADGSSDPFSTVAWISPDGRVTHHPATSFSWIPVETWRSPATGGDYPVRYRLTVPARAGGTTREVLEIRPLAPDQELTGALGGIAYWEGAGDVLDARGRTIGRCYTELTGYAETLEGKF